MLKEYVKIKAELDKLEEQKDALKEQIVKILQDLPGKNEDKEYIEADLKAWAVYKKKTDWDDKGIELVKKLYPKCIKETVDNALLEKICEDKHIENLDALRTVSWSKPTLYVKPVKEEK